ncbi:MAG TPA: alpha/beta hydrolase-fold protein [Gemmatimonadaceae bacterium]|nr:alpha/beta hydrolase-fold protein [Gemmatimonadaceae bacterium]
MKCARTILLLVLLASPAAAQQSPWLKETFKSAKLGEDRTIYVATPANYSGTAQRYPVLVLLDANDEPQWAAAVANVAFLSSRGAIPDLLIVGVTNGKDRTHDMTPGATGGTARNFPTAGGAPAFADFIVDEVLPRVRSHYRTLPSTILAGHSFGGLFALDVAATRPGAFAGIVAMSPSLWWNDSTPARDYATAIAKTSATTRLFATSGELEPPIDVTTKIFAARLDSIKPASLAFAYHYYADDTHGLTPQPSLIDGLRFVFAPIALTRTPVMALGPKADSASIVKAITETEDAYVRGARSLGLPDKFPESQMNNFGYAILQSFKMPNVAVWAFRKNVANYPDSPNVYDSLGDALLAAGDSTGARGQFRMARDVAVRQGKTASEETLKKLAALEHPTATQAGKVKP